MAWPDFLMGVGFGVLALVLAAFAWEKWFRQWITESCLDGDHWRCTGASGECRCGCHQSKEAFS